MKKINFLLAAIILIILSSCDGSVGSKNTPISTTSYDNTNLSDVLNESKGKVIVIAVEIDPDKYEYHRYTYTLMDSTGNYFTYIGANCNVKKNDTIN